MGIEPAERQTTVMIIKPWSLESPTLVEKILKLTLVYNIFTLQRNFLTRC